MESRSDLMKKNNSISKINESKYIKVCPNCGSTQVSSESFNIGVRDICLECGHGSIKESLFVTDLLYFPEIREKEIESFRKELFKNKLKKKKAENK
jgi:ferredoxin-like protein FixX